MRRGCQKATQALAALAVAVWIFAPAGAEAHTGTFWFNHPWQGSIQTAGVWLYASFDMNATEQSRVKDAFKQWNDEPPTIWFNYKGLASFEVHCLPGEARNRNIVTWLDIPPPAVARTEPCREPDGFELDHFDIVVDTDPLWYTGGSATGIDDNEIDGQVDFWAALTHEYGHGLGFRPRGDLEPPEHFEFDASQGASNPCPVRPQSGVDGYESTMCGGVTTEINSTLPRTLELHDKHTFDARY